MSAATRVGPRHRDVASRIMPLIILVIALVTGLASSARAADVTWGTPAASGSLGELLTFETTLSATEAPLRVELLTRLPQEHIAYVRTAGLSGDTTQGFAASVSDASHVSPNTTFAYRFRAFFEDGSSSLGPEATVTVTDDRFAWRALSNDVMTLHWYEGDDAFARRALDIGSRAIEHAATLLGVGDMAPVDFFVYADQDKFYDALGPGTRENVGGQADADIRTMFGLISPSEIGSDWVDTLVTHELTHLVFAEAVDNPYHFPPRWLNEGLAVYLADGLEDSRRRAVEDAARSGELIPLDGIADLFPTTYQRFSLAYSESVHAVDWFIRTYGEEQLVTLITSYAAGVTDDEAFQQAIGISSTAFDDAWMGSLGVARPVPYGPQPAPPGQEPAAWSASPAP